MQSMNTTNMLTHGVIDPLHSREKLKLSIHSQFDDDVAALCVGFDWGSRNSSWYIYV